MRHACVMHVMCGALLMLQHAKCMCIACAGLVGCRGSVGSDYAASLDMQACKVQEEGLIMLHTLTCRLVVVLVCI